VKRPDENVLLSPGDQLFLYRDPKRITFLGATAKNSSVEMETENTMLSDALGQASGLLDSRSDPKGLFVFRYEDAKTLRKLGVDVAEHGSYPVVYNVDFSKAQGVFLAQGFPVRDKDVVYISNAPSTDLQKFLTLLNSGLGAANRAAALGSQL
jgi:polysaccharide biosynthesis/export protein